jgi:hypothetical protein
VTEKELNSYFWDRLTKADFTILYNEESEPMGVKIASQGESVSFIDPNDAADLLPPSSTAIN